MKFLNKQRIYFSGQSLRRYCKYPESKLFLKYQFYIVISSKHGRHEIEKQSGMLENLCNATP